jgi:CDGSH-type Zn-finger protein
MSIIAPNAPYISSYIIVSSLSEVIMARLVRRERSKPYPVTIGGETKYICGCGLSATQPFCDGTHKKSLDEDPSKLCWYDADMGRHDIQDVHPNIRKPTE